MAIYCVLGSFTEQGVRNAKDSPKRAEAFKEMARKCGVTVKDVYWAQGQYDVVTILEASDELQFRQHFSRALKHLQSRLTGGEDRLGPLRRRQGLRPLLRLCEWRDLSKDQLELRREPCLPRALLMRRALVASCPIAHGPTDSAHGDH